MVVQVSIEVYCRNRYLNAYLKIPEQHLSKIWLSLIYEKAKQGL